MFFNAEPPITGTNLLAIVCRRIPAFSSSGVTGFPRDDGLGDVIIEIGNLLDQIVVRLVNNLDILLRHIGDFIRRSELIVVGINDRFLVDNVELAAQLIFLAQRQQNRPRVRAEFLWMLSTDISKSAPTRSILLMNARHGTLYFVA